MALSSQDLTPNLLVTWFQVDGVPTVGDGGDAHSGRMIKGDLPGTPSKNGNSLMVSGTHTSFPYLSRFLWE